MHSVGSSAGCHAISHPKLQADLLWLRQKGLVVLASTLLLQTRMAPSRVVPCVWAGYAARARGATAGMHGPSGCVICCNMCGISMHNTGRGHGQCSGGEGWTLLAAHVMLLACTGACRADTDVMCCISIPYACCHTGPHLNLMLPCAHCCSMLQAATQAHCSLRKFGPTCRSSCVRVGRALLKLNICAEIARPCNCLDSLAVSADASYARDPGSSPTAGTLMQQPWGVRGAAWGALRRT
jgi:hypothetical protein